MPELPEVETVRRRLLTCLPGLVVRDVRVHDATVCELPEAALRDSIAGRRVLGLRRRGKYLLIDLGPVEEAPQAVEDVARPTGSRVRPTSPLASVPDSPARLLIVHLRMTGQLLFRPEPGARPARFVIALEPATELHFADMRRFGRLWSLDPADEESFFTGMGPEPFSADFSVAYLREALAGRRAPLKAFLLDQRRVAGVGNIYADEALFRARLHPLRAAGSVGPREAKRLHAALLETLQAGIDHEGSSIESFIDPAGERGSFQEILNVYQRTGEPCRVCGTAVERVVVGGRGTHYCPRCQPRRGGIAPTARRSRPTGPVGKRTARGAPPSA
jgi:formamidopyrimidine-DNA glycosylase